MEPLVSDVLHYEVTGGVAVVTMNRPESLNALNAELSDGLNKSLSSAATDGAVRVVVITGTGRAFSSGADLEEARHRIAEGGNLRPSEILRDRYHRFITTIVEMEKPVIAAVNGVAAGAGASLAYAADFRIASDKARFMQAFIKIGLVPDAGSNYFLQRLVGYPRALEMAMSGDMIDADTALRYGLVTSVVPHDELMNAAMEMAAAYAAGPTRAYGLTKKAMRFGAANDLQATLDYEADLQDQAALTHDAAEGIGAFLEKRPPRYEGR